MHNEGGLYSRLFARQPLTQTFVASPHQRKFPLASDAADKHRRGPRTNDRFIPEAPSNARSSITLIEDESPTPLGQKWDMRRHDFVGEFPTKPNCECWSRTALTERHDSSPRTGIVEFPHSRLGTRSRPVGRTDCAAHGGWGVAGHPAGHLALGTIGVRATPRSGSVGRLCRSV